MSEAKYRLVGKQFDGVEIARLIIEKIDEGSESRQPISIKNAIKLARDEKIQNAKSVYNVNTNEYLLDVRGGYGTLETIKNDSNISIELKARLITGGKCVGYKAIDNKGKIYKLSIEKVWGLAEQGAVNGVTAKFIGDKKVLIGSLDELPKIIN
jgi:protein-disulfide isomerase